MAYLLIGPATSAAHAVDPSTITVLSSENISTEVSNNVLKVYLNTFRPNNVVSFKVIFHNTEALPVINDSVKMTVPINSGLQFALTTGAV